MGKFLTNAKTRENVIKGVKKHGPIIGIVSYIVGLLWMIALPHHELSARNYFSENQLLPGLVETYFSLSHSTHIRTLDNLKAKCSVDTSEVKNTVKEEFNKLGFDIYNQNFAVPSKFINGTNIYGVLRSPRASGVESIILNVPLHQDCSSLGSLALMLGLASYFRDQTYWAKDIIFLVTEYDLHGIQAWLNGYFHDSTPGIHAEDLHGHGGSIQAAVVLDFPDHFINYFDILFVGANGLLPNLDYINLMSRLATLEGVPAKFEYQTELYQGKEQYVKSLETLIRMMAVHTSGYPTGNHGMFFKYRIEAVTLRGANNPFIRYRKEVGLDSIGRMLEGVFRSINNMLEHFHQSFFLYVLPNTFTYISIGMYMPPLGCLVLPLAIHLIILWINIFKLDKDITAGNNHEKENEHMITMSPLLDAGMLKQILLSYTLSMACYFGLSYYFDNIDFYSPSVYQLFFILLASCYGAVVVVTLSQSSSNEINHNLKFFGLLHLALLITVASIFNFSAAFVIATFYTPLAVTVVIPGGRARKFLQVIFSLLSSPPVLIGIILMETEISLENSDLSALFTDMLPKWRDVLIEGHIDTSLPIWTKDLIYLTILPMWITLSSIR